MNRVFWPLAACLMLAGCGGGDSSLNPLRWFGGGKAAPRATDSLAPKGGYEGTEANRLPVAQVLTARWEPTVEGRLLVVTALAPTKGWWDVELVTATPMPEGRVRPDADGVLRLQLVGAPPAPGSAAAAMPAQQGADTLTVAFPISRAALGRIDSVLVQAGQNAVTLRR
ncbi:hypothetical protein SAMN05444389_102190 [Paracoccus solventivorans]|uniref:Lipoprotein n=1 Tax=Paracoccus solventivorans TaxID=53463 RepID=A0A1M7ELP4_9RHOB|nr:hypothetical protein [Paracoccus solventivorans]SHL92732.1 hypothetical protein SAMN05444389_102190 [Paracoccus solventivorans]